MPAIRPVSYAKLVAVFEKDGFRFVRQEGSHMAYVKPGVKRTLVIPKYREVPVFIIKALLQTAEMSREKYFELLDQL
jgi:predicted RNA binding protein YcfA (HicA-like mRNA interferase family)